MLQKKLLSRGYSLGRFGIDGVYGRSTKEAVKAFQRDCCIKIDGIAGKDTLNCLGIRLIG